MSYSLLDKVKCLKLRIKSEFIPLSIKYEYLKELEDVLSDKYSFFAMKGKLQDLELCFSKQVLLFNDELNKVYLYLKKHNNFLDLTNNNWEYKWLLKNLGVLLFMDSNYKALEIVLELKNEKNKDFPVFDVNALYCFRLKQIAEHLNNYGSLPVQTDREFVLKGGTYMGSFLAHNKRKIFILREFNEDAYMIADYYEKKYLTFEDKLNEVYDFLIKKNYLPYIDDDSIKFSNGEIMSLWFSHNRKKLSLSDDFRAIKIIQYLDQRKGLCFDDKVLELYNLLNTDFDLNADSVFSDGVNIRYWIKDNKKRLIELSEDNEIIKFILKNIMKLSFDDKMIEAYNYLCQVGYLLDFDDKDALFSDGVIMGMWFARNKENILISEYTLLKDKIEQINPHYFDFQKAKIISYSNLQR